MDCTIIWERSEAKSFAHQLKDVIKYENETNNDWSKYDAGCKQLIDVVIPKLLGAIQSDDRETTPTLIHVDLLKGNVGFAIKTGKNFIFDPGSTYAP